MVSFDKRGPQRPSWRITFHLADRMRFLLSWSEEKGAGPREAGRPRVPVQLLWVAVQAERAGVTATAVEEMKRAVSTWWRGHARAHMPKSCSTI